MPFITFEGPEGGGKSTQIRELAAWLEDRGCPLTRTREPGGTPLGDMIRKVIFSPESVDLTAEAELLLFNASRAQLVRQQIRPALEAGRIVLCDRYVDASLVYQGYGQGLPLAQVQAVNAFATGGLVPDLTLLLDLDPAVGLERRRVGAAAGAEWNRLDREALAFHRRVHAGYHALAAAEPARWRIIDASPAPEVVQRALRAVVGRFLDEGSWP